MLKSVILSALLALSAFQTTEAVTYSAGCNNNASIASGTYTTTVNGTEREYIVRVPQDYDPSVAYPFIIAYHWYGGSAYNVTQDSSKYGNDSYYGLVSLANESAIFVAPQGLNVGWWNTNDDDMTFTDTIVETIDEGLCVDQDQRFVVGFSFGGSMTNAIANSGRGTTFKAAAVLSGTDYTTAIGEPVPIGFFVAHGVSDPGNLISKGRSMRDVFVEVNGCTNQTAPEPAPGSGSHIKTSYANCSKPVTFIAFDGVHQSVSRHGVRRAVFKIRSGAEAVAGASMGAGSSSELPMSRIDVDSYTGRRYTVEVPGTRDESHGPAYEVPAKEPVDEAEMTLHHNFLRGCSIENGARPLYGRRAVDPATGRAGAFEWLSYNEVKTRTERVASGLQTVGALGRQDVVGVFSKNQLEWCLVAHACDRMSYVLVPLYDTLGPDAVPFIVNHTELRVLFCGKKQFDVVMDCVENCPALKIIIQFEPVTEKQVQQAAAKNVELRSLDELELLGEADPKPADPPKPADVSTLCYTSGTTGDPKGVILLQRNYAYVVRQMCSRMEIFPSDVHCSYLPLAHVFERATLGVLQAHGASAGFYQGDLLTLMEDLVELRPTVFVSVPRLFNRVYDKITQGVAAAGGLKKILFDRALAAKLAGLPEGHKTHALWDALVFSKVRLALGGRVRLIFSGSAPLSAEVKEFMKVVFCCDVAEGYGLSETAAAVTVGSADMPMGPHVGCPLMYGQVQLEDVPEMGYTSRDKPRPRGEILVRGPMIFAGYYKEPEKTREAIDERGWFHTGDIGCWNADGTLSIIDRKKNIFKLAQGEYVAAEKIENIYAKSKYVAQIFAYGDSLQSCLVGIVVPDPETAEAWAQEKGLRGADAAASKTRCRAA
ncbi:unnamed protein product [Phytophthora fragariaefolia]|uniref:Unnamed protein product n=1 Tax=Phytophthora fragariaefolia TaxID=1490495 RepID=A0A9W6TSB1_9STRA|nr:unnamed protein product [Phytophthora fragariaefolia]